MNLYNKIFTALMLAPDALGEGHFPFCPPPFTPVEQKPLIHCEVLTIVAHLISEMLGGALNIHLCVTTA